MVSERAFEFDVTLSPEANIALFLGYLRERDPNLTRALEEALAVLLPLPEAGAERGAKRSEANAKVILRLEAAPTIAAR